MRDEMRKSLSCFCGKISNPINPGSDNLMLFSYMDVSDCVKRVNINSIITRKVFI